MRIKTFEQYINESVNEKAVSAEEVLANEPDTAVIKTLEKKTLKELMKLILYNFKENKVEGYFEMERFRSDKEWQVRKAYAIDKHGPLMYNLALSIVSPDGIIPDSMIRPSAQKIWQYFDKNRPDVKKTAMTPKDPWYYTEFETDLEHEHQKDPEILALINKVYSIDKPFVNTDKLLKKGELLVTKNKLNIKELNKKAEADFYSRYNSELQK